MTIDRVDDLDRPVGTVVRRRVFEARAGFRTCHVFLLDGEGRLLLQQLAPQHSRDPGAWGSSVAAFLFSGETYAAAARRRIGEELGLRDVPLAEVGKLRMQDEGCSKFVTLFMGTVAEPVHADPGQISGVEFLAPDAITLLITSRARPLTPTFVKLFTTFRHEIWRDGT